MISRLAALILVGVPSMACAQSMFCSAESEPVLHSSFLDFISDPISVFVADDFVAVNEDDWIEVWTLGHDGEFKQAFEFDVLGPPSVLYGSGDLMCSVRNSSQIVVYDTSGVRSDPGSIHEVGAIALSGYRMIGMHRHAAYIEHPFDELRTIDLTDPSSPTLIDSPFFSTTEPFSGYVLDDISVLVVVEDDGDATTFDISDPLSPSLLATGSIDSGWADELQVVGHSLFWFDGHSSFRIIDVSEKGELSLPEVAILPTSGESAVISGNRVWVSNELYSEAYFFDRDTLGFSYLGYVHGSVEADVFGAGVSYSTEFNPDFDQVFFEAHLPIAQPSPLVNTFGHQAQSNALSDNRMYRMGAGSGGGTAIHELLDDGTQPEVGVIAFSGDEIVHASDDFVVLKSQDGVGFFDVTDPANPVTLGVVTPSDMAPFHSVALNANTLCVANDERVRLYNVEDPAQASQLGEYVYAVPNDGAEGVCVDEQGYVFVGHDRDLLKLDASDPGDIRLVDFYQLHDSYRIKELVMYDRLIFARYRNRFYGQKRFRTFDASTPGLVAKNGVGAGDGVADINVSGDLLSVAIERYYYMDGGSSDGGFRVYRLDSPDGPELLLSTLIFGDHISHITHNDRYTMLDDELLLASRPCNICPGDFNFDGLIAADDVHRFLLYYFGGDPAVDLNSDGETNYFDAVEFILAYQRGCD